MATLRLLLSPLALSLRNGARRSPRLALGLVLGALGLLIGIELVSEWVLGKIMEIPIGHRLVHHLMSMFLFSLQWLLTFSAVINSLGIYFLSKDLDTIHSSPVAPGAVFWARWVEVALTAAWMVVALLVPVFFAYGAVLGAPGLYYLVAPVAVLPMVALCCSAGVVLALLLGRLLPVRRTRDLMRFFAVMGAAVLVVLFRAIQPERLVEPGNFEKLAGYLVSLHPPTLEKFPSFWLTELLFGLMRGDHGFLFPRHLTWYLASGALGLLVARLVFAAVHQQALFKFQEAPPPAPRKAGWFTRALAWPLAALPTEVRALASKDLRVLARSPVVWTQVSLMVVIVGIYAYNLHLVPVGSLETIHRGVTTLVAFGNIGFMGFLLVAAALRFGFPAVSLDGEAFLIVHASPTGMVRYLGAKLLLGAGPLLCMALLLAGLAHHLLDPPRVLVGLAYLDAVLLAVAVGTMALEFGAVFRDLRATSFAHLPSGPGGIGYLVASMALVFVVVALQAYPFWLYREATLFGVTVPASRQALGAAMALASFLVPVASTWRSWRRARASLEGGLER